MTDSTTGAPAVVASPERELPIAVVLLIEKPVYTFAGLFIVLLGIPVYALWRGRAHRAA